MRQQQREQQSPNDRLELAVDTESPPNVPAPGQLPGEHHDAPVDAKEDTLNPGHPEFVEVENEDKLQNVVSPRRQQFQSTREKGASR